MTSAEKKHLWRTMINEMAGYRYQTIIEFEKIFPCKNPIRKAKACFYAEVYIHFENSMEVYERWERFKKLKAFL